MTTLNACDYNVSHLLQAVNQYAQKHKFQLQYPEYETSLSPSNQIQFRAPLHVTYPDSPHVMHSFRTDYWSPSKKEARAAVCLYWLQQQGQSAIQLVERFRKNNRNQEKPLPTPTPAPKLLSPDMIAATPADAYSPDYDAKMEMTVDRAVNIIIDIILSYHQLGLQEAPIECPNPLNYSKETAHDVVKGLILRGFKVDDSCLHYTTVPIIRVSWTPQVLASLN